MRRTPTLIAAAALSLTAASPAAADSIAYVKGGDLWLTTPSADREYQVTATAGYTAVSQADDGTLLATTGGGHLRRVDRAGAVLSDIATPVTDGTDDPFFQFFGPFDADVSPNGATAAYGYVYQSYNGSDIDTDDVTAFTRSDALTGVTEDGYKQTKGWDAPEWIDDTQVLVSNGPGWPSDPIAVVTAGSGDARDWFSDPDNHHPLDATISRNRRMLAAVNEDRTKLHVYRDEDAQLLGTVHPCVIYDDAGRAGLSSPTFSADGSRLAFADERGLALAQVGDSSTGCPAAEDFRDVIAGASNPDWGPADVPPARATPGPAPAPSATPAPAGTATPAPAAHAASLTVTGGRVHRRRALRRGFTVTVGAPAAGRVTVLAARRGRRVATGAATASGPGRLTVRLRVVRRAAFRRSLVLTATQGAACAAGVVKVGR